MCRWITLLSSDDVTLSDIVIEPTNGLLQLAQDASFHPGYSDENNAITNGDGFGVGWYHKTIPRQHFNMHAPELAENEKMFSATFRDTAPAWSNHNLLQICAATRSHCFLAHVRKASLFSSVTQENCHPFRAGQRLLFCHNGRIGNFPKIRRAMLKRLTDEAFSNVRGTTDSEALFGLILTFLQEDGKSIKTPFEQSAPFGHSRLVSAIKKTLKYVNKLLDDAEAQDNYCTLNFALTDGESVVVTRYCDKCPEVMPPSLYYTFGDVDELITEIATKDPEEETMKKKEAAHESLDIKYKKRVAENEKTNAIEKRAKKARLAKESASASSGDSVSGTESVGAEDPASEQENTGDTGRKYDKIPLSLLLKDLLPENVYEGVDPAKAAFIVASGPLSHTQTWTPLPRNSIMWQTRGSLPQLRLLRDKKPTTKILADHTMAMDQVKISDFPPATVPK